MYDDDDKKDDGSVWTSYSDLFTTVAVIFLVMFVFALIKAGVSKMQQVVEKKKHEQELKGKITDKVKKQTESKITKVNSSFDEIAEYEDLINQKMKEMNKFVSKLQDNKKIMKDLIEDQKRKEAQLVVVHGKIKQTEEKLNEEKKQKEILHQKLDQTQQVVDQVTKEKLEKEIEFQKVQQQMLAEQKLSQNKINHLTSNLEQKKILEQSLNEKLKDKIAQIEKLAQLSSQLENKVEKNKKLLDQSEEKIVQQESMINNQVARITELDTWKESKTRQITELNSTIDQLNTEKEHQQKLYQKLSEDNYQLSEHKERLEKNLEEKKDQYTKKVSALEKLTQSHLIAEKQLEQVRKDKTDLQVQSQNLHNKVVQYEDLITSLQEENKILGKQKIELDKLNLKKVDQLQQLTAQGSKLKKNNLKLQQDIAHKGQELKDLQNKNEYYEKTLSDRNVDVQTLRASLETARSQIENYKGQLGSVQVMNDQLAGTNQRLQTELKQASQSKGLLQFQNKQLRQDLLAAEQASENMRKQNSQLAAQMNVLKSHKGNASRKIASVESQVDQMKMLNEKQQQNLMSCNKEKEGLSKTNQDLKESLDDFATKIANVKGKLRSSIAHDLAEAFKKAKLNVMVDRKTGNVVFLMDKNFRFKKNSAYLNKAARMTLKKVIPIYSKVLFGNKDIKDKVAGFNVVGHASPSHGGKYVAPLSSNSKAYSYNMRLSAQRAASVANYIFGRKIGKYGYKRQLKDYTRAIGQGYTKPIRKKGRSIASKKNNACGPYDCYASQRVELSFTLKDDVNSINKLIQMAKDLK